MLSVGDYSVVQILNNYIDDRVSTSVNIKNFKQGISCVKLFAELNQDLQAWIQGGPRGQMTPPFVVGTY